MAGLEGIFPINTQAGVKRDGTEFESNYYSDSLWCRFQRGRPRKIGGYRMVVDTFSGPLRGCHADAKNGYNYVYGGSSNVLEMITMDNTGAGSGITDRTPASFTTNANNLWQFDTLYDAGGAARRVIAHAGQNLSDITQSTQTPIYYGDANGTGALTSIGTSVSGGIVSLFPYLLGLDNDGYVLWTPPNTMSFAGAGSGNARIAPNKLIKGVRTRGGSGYSPSGLIWSLDELYRAYFSGGSTIFSFDYVGDTILLSTSAVIEYNGRQFWPDLNGFKTYNGAIEDLPNDINVNYFYDNLNKAQRQKVWGIKIPRYNELWWFWPKGSATECTDVLIFNIKEKTWYDTSWAVDQLARSCGIYSKAFDYPLMFGLDPNAGSKYKLWQHEFGVDRVEGGITAAIRSYFETSNISFCASPGGANSGWVGEDRWVEIMRIEPDFVQAGDMAVTVRGKKYAQDAENLEAGPYTFSPTTGKIDVKEQRRQMTLLFESNTQGGDYQLGQTMMHLIVGDGRQ